MTATYTQANDEILTLFKTAWDTVGWGAIWPNREPSFNPEDSNDPWARVELEHFDGDQVSLAGGLGTSRFEREGLLTAQVFVPAGEGLVEAYTLCDLISTAFEGKTTPSGVWFKNVRIREVGATGKWFQINMRATFNYDQVK